MAKRQLNKESREDARLRPKEREQRRKKMKQLSRIMGTERKKKLKKKIQD